LFSAYSNGASNHGQFAIFAAVLDDGFAEVEQSASAPLLRIAASGTHVWVTDLNRIIELNASNGSVVRVIKANCQSLELALRRL
jgi:hypothetical protein